MTAKPREPHVGLVVEGAGDRDALPVLLRSYLAELGEYRDLLGKPVPAHGRGKALVAKGIEGYVATAALRPGCVGVLVVLDGEGDCVAELGPDLYRRASEVCKVPVRVALADADFEDWIYASAETLGLDMVYEPGARGQACIKKALRPAAYTKPIWQPRLANRMNVGLAKGRSVSLKRMLCRFMDLVHLIDGDGPLT